jgi:hypothetical protein
MRVDEKNDGQNLKIFLDLDRGRGRDGDEKKICEKKIFIAITTATAIKTGTYKNFQKNPVFPLSVQEGHTRWVNL